MEYLVFSDSHGNPYAMNRILTAHPHAGGVFFCGDGLRDLIGLSEAFPGIPIYAVRGNCDYGDIADGVPEDRLLTLEGVRILLMHGHRYGVKTGMGAALAHAAAEKADLLLYGHTHFPAICTERVGERYITLANPGSIGRAADGGCRYGVLTIQKRQFLFSLAESQERM